MRPNPDADSELLSRPKSSRRHRPFRSLGHLMTLVALSGLTLAAYSGRWRPQQAGVGMRYLNSGQRAPGSLRQTPVPSTPDRLIIIAPRGVDEAMIVTAREGIDEAMIVQPGQMHTGSVTAQPIQPILPPLGTGRMPLNGSPMVPREQPHR